MGFPVLLYPVRASCNGSLNLRRGRRRAVFVVLDTVFALVEFPGRLTEPTGEFRQLLRTKHEQDDEQDDDEIRSGEVKKAGNIHKWSGVFHPAMPGRAQSHGVIRVSAEGAVY